MSSMTIFGYVLTGCFSLVVVCATVKLLSIIFKDKQEDKKNKEDKGE